MNPVLVILSAVFIILFVTMILIVVLGQDGLSQFSQITDQLRVSLLSVGETLISITSNVVSSLTQFGRTAVTMFTSLATQVGGGFLSITDFVQNELSGMITTITQESLNAITVVTQTTLGGVFGTANAVIAISNSLNELFNQVVSFIFSSISAFIIFMIETLTSGLLYVIQYIGIAIQGLLDGITIILEGLVTASTAFYCGLCTVCCFLPGVSCSLSNNRGASCCGVDGCGGCDSGQHNVCDDI